MDISPKLIFFTDLADYPYFLLICVAIINTFDMDSHFIGLFHNKYSANLQYQVTMDDLFG